MSRWPRSENQPTTFGKLTRSQLMSRVRSQGNATTELRLAKALREGGIRGWRRHVPLLGSPDFAWTREKVVVFVDGCFWHGHSCRKNLSPKNNSELWREKLARNKRRDRKVTRKLRGRGWSVVRIWECELKQRPCNAVRRVRSVLTKRRRPRENVK